MRTLFSFLAIIAILVGCIGTWYIATTPADATPCGNQTQLEGPAVICESAYVSKPPIWLFIGILVVGVSGLVLNLTFKRNKSTHRN